MNDEIDHTDELPTPIQVCVESAATTQAWMAIHARAREEDHDMAPDADLRVLVTHQANAADNGVWIVGPDGSCRRAAFGE